MRKELLLIGCAAALSLVTIIGIAADSVTQTKPDNPLTPELAKEVRKNPYVDESVQTTNGNMVGIFTEAIYDQKGLPILAVIQAYENVGRPKDFVALPWPILRFDKQNRRIEVESAAGQIRKAPKFTQEQLRRLADDRAEVARIYQHFGAAMGGGAVAATMGTQSGQGSSALAPPPTNEAQPDRGSVGIMYVLGILAVAGLAVGYFVRRRA
jgi:hypothetical protein